jgi:hypothetical protein
MVMVTDVLCQEDPPDHKYPSLFQHSAITEDPTLTSKVLLISLISQYPFGNLDRNVLNETSLDLSTCSNIYVSTYIIAH